MFNRRKFVSRSLYAALGGAPVCSAMGNLQLLAAAANAQSTALTGYKALVCIFLNGGNDSFNTIIPVDSGNHGIYAATRPALAIPQSEIVARTLTPQLMEAGLAGGAPSDGGQYALHPAMAPLQALFNGQKAAIIANVGTLLGPLTQAQYQAGTGSIPPLLFSHDDQASTWQTSRPDDANAVGWGGRMADLLQAANPNQKMPMNISLGAQSVFQRSAQLAQYVMAANGVKTLDYINLRNPYQNEQGSRVFYPLIASGVQSHMFERTLARATQRSISTYQMLETALRNLPVWETPFPPTLLGAQLQQVANVISARIPTGLNMRRQVFYVNLGGFDTHDEQLQAHPVLLSTLAYALNAFYAATAQMGIASEVTTFTASDFGRSLSTNGDGSDHGWGGHHFVVGGAVRGGRFYGKMPSLRQNGNPDDTGYGQIIPTTGVDQYAATLAAWFGVEPGQLPEIFPSLSRYSESNLGFMQSV